MSTDVCHTESTVARRTKLGPLLRCLCMRRIQLGRPAHMCGCAGIATSMAGRKKVGFASGQFLCQFSSVLTVWCSRRSTPNHPSTRAWVALGEGNLGTLFYLVQLGRSWFSFPFILTFCSICFYGVWIVLGLYFMYWSLLVNTCNSKCYLSIAYLGGNYDSDAAIETYLRDATIMVVIMERQLATLMSRYK